MAFKKLTFDASAKKDKPFPKDQFAASRAAEREFNKALKMVARSASGIVNAHIDGVNIENQARMEKALSDYAEMLGPWARRQSTKLLAAVSRKNKAAYEKNSKAMGVALRMGVAESNVGKVARALVEEQVALIKSIPIEAGQRAVKLRNEAITEGARLSMEGVYSGTRADEIAKELQRTTGVTEARATLIARTETARANSAINEARATAVGSQRYIWRNSGDGAVRDAHKKRKGKPLDGQLFSWDSPPTLDDGTTGHPGTFPNCRCYAEAVFDD